MATSNPNTGDLSNAANTKAQQKAFFEALRDTISSLLGGADPEGVEIASGVVQPVASLIVVDTEGQAADDDLDRVDYANMHQNNILVLRVADAGRVVTIKNNAGGDGSFRMLDDADRVMDKARFYSLFIRDGNLWVEAFRGFGPDKAAERAFLGLGSAALANEGAIDAGTLEGIAAAGFYQVGQPVGDADTVDGFEAAAFIRASVASEQFVTGAFRSDGAVLKVNSPIAGVAAFLQYLVTTTLRARSFMDPVDNVLGMELLDTDGITKLAGFRVNDAGAAEMIDPLTELWIPFDAGTLGGFDRTTLPVDRGMLVLDSAEVSGTISQSDRRDKITMNRTSFFPALEVEQDGGGATSVYMAPEFVGNANADATSPAFELVFTGSGSGAEYSVAWEYIRHE